MWMTSGRVKKRGEQCEGLNPFCIYFAVVGSMSTSHETQSHITAFYTKCRWKKEFLPQTTSDLSIRHKYPLITIHDLWGGETPVYIREVHPLAVLAVLAHWSVLVMTVLISDAYRSHLIVEKRRKPEASKTAYNCLSKQLSGLVPAVLPMTHPLPLPPHVGLPPALGQCAGIWCLESHFPVRINNPNTIAWFLAPRPHLNVGQSRPKLTFN